MGQSKGFVASRLEVPFCSFLAACRGHTQLPFLNLTFLVGSETVILD